MSHVAATIIMAAASLIALSLLVITVRRARAAGDLDASVALTLGMGVLVSVPVGVVAISGGVTRRPDALRQLVAVYPGWYVDADRLGKLLLLALCVLLVLRRSSSSIPINAAGLFAISLWALAQLASGLHGGPLLTGASLVLLACLIAATILPRGRGACLGAGIFGVTLAIASAVLAIFRPEVAFVTPCQLACGGLGFTGVLPNPNLLGVTLAASIPFAYLGFRGRSRYWFALYLAGMAIATGSRTAIVAAAITALGLCIVRPSIDANARTFGRAAVAWLVLVGAVVACVVITRHHWDPSALTHRPALWTVASDYIHRSPWVGYGPDRWASLYGTSEIPQAAQRSTHNQVMDVLFVTGGIGAALLISMLVATLSTAGRARLGAALALATIATIGTTEGAWSIGAFDFMSFSMVALILIGDPTGRELAVSRVLPRPARQAEAPIARSLTAAAPSRR